MKKLKNVSLVGNTGYFDNELDFAGSEGLDGVKVVKHQASCGSLRLSHCSISLSLSFRNSSVRKWQRCNFLHSVRPSPSVPRNTQFTSVSSLKASSAQCKSSFFMFVATLCLLRLCSETHCLSPVRRSNIRFLWRLMRKWRTTFSGFRAKLNVLDTPDVDASTTRSTQRAQKVGNAWKSLSLSFTDGEGDDDTRSPHSVQSSPSLFRNKQFLEVSRLRALSGDDTATHYSLRLVRAMVLGHRAISDPSFSVVFLVTFKRCRVANIRVQTI